MAPLERDYQPKVIAKIKGLLPGCMILKNNSAYLPGIPDWIVLYGERWAALEIKRKKPTKSDWQPNQEYYLEQLGEMSYSACVYPENEEEVLNALRKALQH